MTEKRRRALQELLTNASEPITGTQLAHTFKVSRQVIVQDIAVMRAGGVQIVGGLNGYWIPDQMPKALRKTFMSYHSGESQMEEELQIVVDYGGRMLNIAVVHPIYGDIVCPLSIRSREDIKEFLVKLKDENATPLSALTEGVHFHTIEIDSEVAFEKLMKALVAKGFIPQM